MLSKLISKQVISTATNSSRGMCFPNMKTIVDTKPTMGTMAVAIGAGTAAAATVGTAFCGAIAATFWAVDKINGKEKDKLPIQGDSASQRCAGAGKK
jgi:hypothetical protein